MPTILELSREAVISVDERGLVTYWNPSAERLFGFARSEVMHRPLAELIIAERDHAAFAERLERSLSAGAEPVLADPFQMTAVRAGGGELAVEVRAVVGRQGAAWTFTAIVSESGPARLLDQIASLQPGTSQLFDAIVGSLSDPVTVRARDDRLIYANPAALRHLGLASLDELRGTRPTEIMAGYHVFAGDGSELSLSDIPSVRILEGRPAEPLLIRAVNLRTGNERWNLLKAAPLLDQAGEVEATIMITEDVTEQRRAERDAAFLVRAGEVLASSLDYERTLRNVAELAVPDIVDWCAVDLLDQDGGRRSVVVAHADPERRRLAEVLRSYQPEQLDPDRGLGLVLRTGEPLVYPEIPEQMLEQAAVDSRHLELLREVGLRSAAVVPMRLGDRTLGAMTFVNADSRRSVEPADLDLAQQLATRAAVAIENARLFSERSRIAHTLQQSLLPDRLPNIPGYELASVYLPAVARTEVGGDFYDAWEAGEGWFVAIGDVTGKGVEAAATTALVRHTLRTASEFLRRPAELLGLLDRRLKKQPTLDLCTVLCIRLVGERATIAAGGHPLPLHLTSAGAAPVGEAGPLLGGLEDPVWNERSVTLAPGTALVLYTDGVTDAIGRDRERFGQHRLREVLARSGAGRADAVVSELAAAVAEFQMGPQADDTAILAVRRLGAAETGGSGSAAGDPDALVAGPG